MLTKVSDKHTKYILIFWSLCAFILVFLITWFILIMNGKLGFMPSFRDLENPKNNLASEVITEDNKLLGAFYVENRSYVGFNELSPNLVNALIAREDHRFRRHSGIDLFGLARVMVRTVMLGHQESGGGSTITQQLAKNLFPRDTINYRWNLIKKITLINAKFKEWITSARLERNYTKDEIIVMYFNTVFFGHDAYGIKSASLTFYNKTPDSLKVEEAALLVGMLKGPTMYSPVRNPDRAKLRRDGVMEKMKEHGFISEHQFDSLIKIPIILNFSLQNHTQGYGTYFRAYLGMLMNRSEPIRTHYQNYSSYQEDSLQWVSNTLYGWCFKNLKPDGTPYDIYRDGLKIRTTINFTMQKYAEDAMREHLTILQDQFFKERKETHHGPFAKELKPAEVENIMLSSMHRTDRYRILRSSGMSYDSIMKNFKTPTHITVFSWRGEIDTIMTPWDSIKYYKFYLQSGFVAIDPKTGYVKAYVGGPNFKHFKYDHVIVGKRQVGSTIKPFLYTLAMQEGMTPCDLVPNRPVSFIVKVPNLNKDKDGSGSSYKDSIWTPRNSGQSEYEGKMVPIVWGLANSVNNVAAWLIKRFNPESVIEIMRSMGISSKIDAVPSICLGTSDISLYEMVSAYGSYANKGIHVTPIFVTRIEDKNGNVLADFKTTMTESINESTAYLMINMLKAVVSRGTAQRLHYRYQFKNEIAAKTGTSQNQSDGWFVGITPTLVGGVWVGAEDRSVHFDDINSGQGASMALPIWAMFMQKVLADEALGFPTEPFDVPANFRINTNCDLGIGAAGENETEGNEIE
jgi:penicillin-binding protein 1A